MYQLPPDVEHLVAEQLRQGTYDSQEDVLRAAMRALAEKNEDLAAIRAGIQEMESGQTRPLADVDADIRRNLGFAPRQ